MSTLIIQKSIYLSLPIEISKPASVADIERAILIWFDLLAKEKYTEAFHFVGHDPYYQWTPELLELTINGYRQPHVNKRLAKSKVTDWTTALVDKGKHYKEINMFPNSDIDIKKEIKVIGEVYYDLPIDCKWSDLTATFKILERQNYTTLELNEIHVM